MVKMYRQANWVMPNWITYVRGIPIDLTATKAKINQFFQGKPDGQVTADDLFLCILEHLLSADNESIASQEPDYRYKDWIEDQITQFIVSDAPLFEKLSASDKKIYGVLTYGGETGDGKTKPYNLKATTILAPVEEVKPGIDDE